MPSPTIIRYPLDPTGLSVDNLVQGEPHLLTRRKIRAIALNHGAFFKESVRVYDAVTQQPLVPDVQFEATEMYELPTARYGKEICSIILITDETVGDSVYVDYQVLGAEYSTSAIAIVQMLDKVNLDNRPVAYADITRKPTDYNPSHHLHDAGDIYGFEYLVHALDRVRRAIEMGDDISHTAIYRYIQEKFDQLPEMLSTDQVQQLINQAQEDYNAALASISAALVRNLQNDIKTTHRINQVEDTTTALLLALAPKIVQMLNLELENKQRLNQIEDRLTAAHL